MSLIKDALDKAQKSRGESAEPPKPEEVEPTSTPSQRAPDAPERSRSRFWLVVLFLFVLALVVGGEIAYLFLYVL